MKKLDLFPEKRFELYSPLSVEDALYALDNEIFHSKPTHFWLQFKDIGEKKYIGYINKNTFEAVGYSALWRINNIKISGEVTQNEKGSKIALSFNLRKGAKISLTIFPLIPVLFSLYTSISIKDPLAFIVVSVFVIGLYLTEGLSINLTIKLLLKDFKKILCA